MKENNRVINEWCFQFAQMSVMESLAASKPPTQYVQIWFEILKQKGYSPHFPVSERLLLAGMDSTLSLFPNSVPQEISKTYFQYFQPLSKCSWSINSINFLIHKIWLYSSFMFRARPNSTDFRDGFIETQESRHLCIHFFSSVILVPFKFIQPRIFLIMSAVMKFSFIENASY